jgi:SWIM zinc finger
VLLSYLVTRLGNVLDSLVTDVPPPWSADQVLSLAPDASARRAARSLAADRAWSEVGLSVDGVPPTVWGLCHGSGPLPYETCVDLTEPAYRCSCPSRKFPCKHTLALLLRWASGGVPEAPAPRWVREWQASRADRASRALSRVEQARNGGEGTGRAAGERAALRRAGRVATGLAELDRWLADQVRAGLAGVSRLGYAHWDAMAARLIDAQAPGAARLVRNLGDHVGDPPRLLVEIGLLRLLAAGFSRLDSLPPELAATVRLRVGMPLAAEEVLAGPAVRDHWQILGVRDEPENDLLVRRVWLRGADTGRAALVLSFAGPGQVFVTDLVPGTELEADLHFYPDRLRVLISRRHAPAAPLTRVAGALPVGAAMREYAEALAADPWLERWPMVLAEVVPARTGDPAGSRERWCLVPAGEGVAPEPAAAADGVAPDPAAARDGVPLDPAVGSPWRLVAAAAGRPVTVAGEWTAAGLRPLSVWVDDRLVRL